MTLEKPSIKILLKKINLILLVKLKQNNKYRARLNFKCKTGKIKNYLNCCTPFIIDVTRVGFCNVEDWDVYLMVCNKFIYS